MSTEWTVLILYVNIVVIRLSHVWNCIRLLDRRDLSWSVQSCKFLILFPLTGDAHDQNSEKIAKWIVDNNRYTSFCVKGQREKRIALQSGKLCKKKKVIKLGQCVCIFSLFVLPKSLYIDRIGITDNTGL